MLACGGCIYVHALISVERRRRREIKWYTESHRAISTPPALTIFSLTCVMQCATSSFWREGRSLVVGNGQSWWWLGKEPSGVSTYVSKSWNGECANSKVVGMGWMG